jgi:hypothetical protein
LGELHHAWWWLSTVVEGMLNEFLKRRV